MYIEIAPRQAKNLNLALENIRNPENRGAAWEMAVFSVDLPQREDFLYLAHPETGIAVVHKLSKGWRDYLKSEVYIALESLFEILNERGIDVKSYRNELETIHFIPLEGDLRDFHNQFKRSIQGFIEQFSKTNRKDWPFFNSEYVFLLMNDYSNRLPKTNGAPSSYELFAKFLESYPSQPKEEVPFDENKLALSVPNITPFFSENPESFNTDKKYIALDSILFSIKEPRAKNESRFQKLYAQLSEAGRRVADDEVLSKREEKNIEKIRKEIGKLIFFYLTPFTGAYKNTVIPETLPEEPVLEFLVTLDMDGYVIRRKIAVSADMSFEDFAYLLNRLFKWQGFPYHMSAFYFASADKPGSDDFQEKLSYLPEDFPKEDYLRPPDWSHEINTNPYFDIETKNIKDFKLRDFFPEHKTAQYRYDFGDNWFHAVELTGIYDKKAYDKELPYLIDAAGTAPPEDIGGITGFNNLLAFDTDMFMYGKFNEFIEEFLKDRSFYLKSPCSLAPLFEDQSKKIKIHKNRRKKT